MFSGILGAVTGQLDRRFVLNAFFPTLVYALLMGVVVVSGTCGVQTAIEWWTAQDALIQTLLAIGGVTTVFVAANVLSASMLAVTRIFEGYSWFLRPIADFGRRSQLRKYLNANAEAKRRSYPFPYGESFQLIELAPTQLGNRLRNGETYPRERYGVDPVRTWPLFYHVIPETLRSSLDEARASMELLLVVAFWAGLFSVTGSICLLSLGSGTAWTLGALLGGASVSLLAYTSALAPARVYSGHIRATFDLHRFELLSALQFPIPATLEEEQLIWPQVVSFLDEGQEHTWRYVKGKSS